MNEPKNGGNFSAIAVRSTECHTLRPDLLAR